MSAFDGAILTILCLFLGFGFMRGLMRSLSGVFGGVLAFLGTVTGVPLFYPALKGSVSDGAWFFILVVCLTFLCLLLLLFFLGDVLTNLVRKGRATRWMDNILGGAFGLIKGIALIGVLFWITTVVAPDFLKEKEKDSWAAPQARSLIDQVKEEWQDWVPDLHFFAFVREQFFSLGAALEEKSDNTLALHGEQSLRSDWKMLPLRNTAWVKAHGKEKRVALKACVRGV